MFHHVSRIPGVAVLLLSLGMAACAPAAQPSPTAAPAKPAATTAPAAPKPTEAPAAKPAEAKPAASPAAKAEAKPAEAKPAASPAAKPAEAKPAASPAAKATFDEKAVADFYRGKNVRIIVGFSAGGGYDTYARLISRHIGRHIPGNPTIVVENMPGAGSMLAANTVYNQSPKDGTVMTTFIGGMITQKVIVENPAAQFDPMLYNWVGGPTPDTAACAVRKESGFTTMEQTLSKELILGGTAPGSTTNDIPNTLKVALGVQLKLVDGYGGTADIRLAADKGEVHGGCWGWESIRVTWKDAIQNKDVNVLGQGGAAKHPDLRDVPHFLDIAKTDEAKKLIQAGVVAPGQISRTFALPPGVPEERVTAMRQAFLNALKDPQLLDDAGKANLDISPVPAEEFYARIKDLQDLPADLKAKLKAAVSA